MFFQKKFIAVPVGILHISLYRFYMCRMGIFLSLIHISVISEGGGNLSGGQKQRIAIARIFLRKPKILILDEATSALDNTSERFIQNEIEQLKKENNMTILSIAHRLTTLKNCDNIIVMDHGQVVQSGKYDTLINQEGIFSDMYYGKLK